MATVESHVYCCSCLFLARVTSSVDTSVWSDSSRRTKSDITKRLIRVRKDGTRAGTILGRTSTLFSSFSKPPIANLKNQNLIALKVHSSDVPARDPLTDPNAPPL